jgi:uncharacterized phage protein gp47/JayE
MSINHINYTSRDYTTLRNDLIQVVKNQIPEWDSTEQSDFTGALVEAFAYMGDVMSYYIDRAANESHIQTATQRDTLLRFAEVVGYKPSGPTPAAGVVTLKNTKAPGGEDINIPIGTQISVETLNGTIYFETTVPVTGLPAQDEVEVSVIEGKTCNTEYGSASLGLPTGLGTSNGTAYMTFTLPDKGVIDSSIEVYTGNGSSLKRWIYTTTLAEHNRFDKVYTTRMNGNGTVSIMFGDGLNGSVPIVGEEISAIYRTGSGFSGNIKAFTPASISFIPPNVFPTSSITIPVEVTITQDMVGGTDGENVALIRQNLKKALGTRNRAVTLEDYAKLAVLVPGISRASASSSIYSQINLYVQSYNDGTTTPGVASDTGNPTPTWNDLADRVLKFLDSRSPVNTTVIVNPPTYVKLDISLNVTVADGYRQSDVKTAVTRKFLDIATGLFSYYGYGFKSTVSVSDVIASARTVPGVVLVELNILDRMTDPEEDIHGTGVGNVTMDSHEIPSLPPENLIIEMTGGIV